MKISINFLTRVETIQFFVQGSAPEPYKVIFHRNGNNISALCSCPAGENGMYCKHRFRIFDGLKEGIVSKNISDVEIIRSWVVGSDIEKAINELQDAESEFEKIKKKVSSLKKNLARKMFD